MKCCILFPDTVCPIFQCKVTDVSTEFAFKNKINIAAGNTIVQPIHLTAHCCTACVAFLFHPVYLFWLLSEIYVQLKYNISHSANFKYLLGTKQFKLSEPKAILKPCFKLCFAATGEPLVCDCHCLNTAQGFWFFSNEIWQHQQGACWPCESIVSPDRKHQRQFPGLFVCVVGGRSNRG